MDAILRELMKMCMRESQMGKGGGLYLMPLLLVVELATLGLGAIRLVDPVNGPYYTIGNAVAGVSPGDEVVIKAGTYRESIRIAAAGTAENPILIRAETGREGEVIVKGSEVYEDWEYTSSLADGRAYRTTVRYDLVESNSLPESASQYSRRADMVFVDGAMLEQVLSLGQLRAGTFYVPDASGTRGLYIGLDEDISPNDVVVEVSERQVGLYTDWVHYPHQHSEYIHIKGLTVTQVACTRDGSGAMVSRTGAIYLGGLHHRLENCRATWNNWKGLQMAGSDVHVVDCLFNYNGSCGMGGGIRDCRFENVTTNYNSWRFGPTWEAGGMKWVGTHDWIRNNEIIACTSQGNNGPGMWFDTTGADMTIRDCRFEDNIGKGIFLEAIYPNTGGIEIHNNIISGTRWEGGDSPIDAEDGVGLCLYGASNSRVYNNTIVDNAQHGISITGGLHTGTGANISHNEFYNNIVAYNGGYSVHLHTWGGSWQHDGTHRLDYNLYHNIGGDDRHIWWRTDPNVYDSYEALTIAGFRAVSDNAAHSICADPCFVDASVGDYHLKSIACRWNQHSGAWTRDDGTSRGIDAGNPGWSLGDELSCDYEDSNGKAANLRINLGVYGGTREASVGPYGWALLADVTNDGMAHFLDLAELSISWLNVGSSQEADLDRNGRVDMDDYVLFAEAWRARTCWRQF